MTKIDLNRLQTSIGELVWIPAHTPLMYYKPEEESEFAWRAVNKNEPTYGLIVDSKENLYRVLVEKEEFYVQKKLVYGVENDY